jgi:hypothetical protein
MWQSKAADALILLTTVRVGLYAVLKEAEKEPEAGHLCGLLEGALSAVIAAERLTEEAQSAAKFLELRKAHGLD